MFPGGQGERYCSKRGKLFDGSICLIFAQKFQFKGFFWSLFEVWSLFDWKHMCKWRIMSDIAEGCSSRLVVFHFIMKFCARNWKTFLQFYSFKHCCRYNDKFNPPIAISSNCRLKIPYSKLNFIYAYMSGFIRITRM